MGKSSSFRRRRRSCARSGRPVGSCPITSSMGAFPARPPELRIEMDKTIAAIADVHGNTWALDAVLENIGRRGIEQIVNLGDCVYGSLDPAGTAAQLMDARIMSIAGNQDRD